MDRLRHMVEQVRVEPGAKVGLGHRRPDDKLGQDDRDAAELLMIEVAERVGTLAAKLGASQAKGLLVVLQGMDASGKDGTIRHCFDFIHPAILHVVELQGADRRGARRTTSCGASTPVPRRGEVGDLQPLALRGRAGRAGATSSCREERWEPRYERSTPSSSKLGRRGHDVLKFFLHISREEQAERLQERLDDPTKHWKFDEDDLRSASSGTTTSDAYEDAMRAHLDRRGRRGTSCRPTASGCATSSSRRCSRRRVARAWSGRSSTPPYASCESPEEPAAARPLDEGGTMSLDDLLKQAEHLGRGGDG